MRYQVVMSFMVDISADEVPFIPATIEMMKLAYVEQLGLDAADCQVSVTKAPEVSNGN